MTTDLEKQFFDTFGIEPRQWYKISMGKKGNFYNEPSHKRYPKITDSILLELICIDFNENPYKCRGGQTSIDEVKERILSDFIHEFENDLYSDKEDIKQQVQALFKE